MEFDGGLCGTGTDVTIDVAVVYTPAVRAEAGGTVAIEAEIDLMVAEANQAYEASGVHHRLALVERSVVPYTGTGDIGLDLDRLADPSDGHMDGVHEMRDRVGADLVHLMVRDGGGVAGRDFSVCAGYVGYGITCFAHELGHNMGLGHDRYQAHHNEGGVLSSPGYGYVNQRAFEAGAAPGSCWYTIMAYPTQCDDAGIAGSRVLRFSNPRQRHKGDPLGVPYGVGASDPVNGPADAAAYMNATGPAVALNRDRSTGANRPPVWVGTLPDRILVRDSTLEVDVSQAFADPDADPLIYTVSSSAPQVAPVLVADARVTLTAVEEGTATIQVTATDPGGLTANQWFAVTVPGNRPPATVGTLPYRRLPEVGSVLGVDVSQAFADPDGDPLTYTVSSSAPQVVSVLEAGWWVSLLAEAEGTATIRVTGADPGGLTANQSFTVTVGTPLPFTDDPIEPGVTPIRAIHFTELRTRIDGVRAAAWLDTFAWTDPVLTAGVTRVRLVHLLELRSALAAAYRAAGQPAPRWTDVALVPRTTPIRAVHLMELRAAVVALE